MNTFETRTIPPRGARVGKHRVSGLTADESTTPPRGKKIGMDPF